jgi:3-(3-hydroxy-phenyl)propionate hydroxylase
VASATPSRVWRQRAASPLPQSRRERHPVVIVGAGPVGLTLALDLGLKGHSVLILNKLDFIPAGSKAICFAKRSLDIWDRLGVGERMTAAGVVWNVGKVFRGHGEEPIYRFDLLPVKNQKNPAFINLQQYRAEEFLAEAVERLPNLDLRWGHEMVEIEPHPDGVRLELSCAGGSYTVDAEWVIACDGCRSPTREKLGLEFEGRAFEDTFLVADVRFAEDRPSERWFWFDPPFNPGQSALLHKQPDGIWRLDFQLGPNADRGACVEPAFVEPLVRGMLGQDVQFAEEWYSAYTFQCRRMRRFVHGRVVFAGDSAHLVSPFGARGCNGGIAEADNLGWKLDLVVRGEAPRSLLETYEHEAVLTADVNILNSARATDFMTPKSSMARAFRDATLELAADHAFARPFVNSGRLSTAVDYPDSPLGTPDVDDWSGGVQPGSPALDAPIADGWLLERLGGRFVLLVDAGLLSRDLPAERLDLAEIGDPLGLVRERYALDEGSAYLIRPDQYVAARWQDIGKADIEAALRRAKGCP